jgi:hypothetical protein
MATLRMSRNSGVPRLLSLTLFARCHSFTSLVLGHAAARAVLCVPDRAEVDLRCQYSLAQSTMTLTTTVPKFDLRLADLGVSYERVVCALHDVDGARHWPDGA